VQHRHRVTERTSNASDGLRREGDLGNEHDRSSTALDFPAERLEVHERLPAPRHAEHDGRPTRRESTDCVNSLSLRPGGRGRRFFFDPDKRIPQLLAVLNATHAALHEPANHRVGETQLLAEMTHGGLAT
jgi:hypothetical protein